MHNHTAGCLAQDNVQLEACMLNRSSLAVDCLLLLGEAWALEQAGLDPMDSTGFHRK